MYIFFIIFHDGRRGIAQTAFEAINAAIGQKDFNTFMGEQPKKGYLWSNYVSRQLKATTDPVRANRRAPIQSLNLTYETSTISHNSIQLVQVFRTQGILTIQQLEKKYGTAQQLTGAPRFASNAKSTIPPIRASADSPSKPRRVPTKVSESEASSGSNRRNKRTPPRRVE